MKHFSHSVFGALLAIFLILQPILSKETAREPAKDCWVLTQLNPNSPYSHSQIVLIAPQGVQISASDVKFFMPAPNYDIAIYNTTTQTYYAAPLKEWLSKYSANPFSKTGKYMQKSGAGKVAGLDAERYFMMHGQGRNARKLREVWATTAIGADKHVAEILQHMCGLPEGSVDGVPLRIVRFMENGREDMWVNTLTVKRIATPKNAFKQPTGCKKAKSQLELMINYGENSDLKGLLEGTTNSRK